MREREGFHGMYQLLPGVSFEQDSAIEQKQWLCAGPALGEGERGGRPGRHGSGGAVARQDVHATHVTRPRFRFQIKLLPAAANMDQCCVVFEENRREKRERGGAMEFFAQGAIHLRAGPGYAYPPKPGNLPKLDPLTERFVSPRIPYADETVTKLGEV